MPRITLSSAVLLATLVGSAVVRNLLMVVALALLIKGGRWAPWVLLLAAGMGMIRRAAFLLPSLSSVSWLDPQWLNFHSGADLVFRVVLVAVAVDLLRELKK